MKFYQESLIWRVSSFSFQSLISLGHFLSSFSESYKNALLQRMLSTGISKWEKNKFSILSRLFIYSGLYATPIHNNDYSKESKAIEIQLVRWFVNIFSYFRPCLLSNHMIKIHRSFHIFHFLHVNYSNLFRIVFCYWVYLQCQVAKLFISIFE